MEGHVLLGDITISRVVLNFIAYLRGGRKHFIFYHLLLDADKYGKLLNTFHIVVPISVSIEIKINFMHDISPHGVPRDFVFTVLCTLFVSYTTTI